MAREKDCSSLSNRSSTLSEKISFHPPFSLPPPSRFPANCSLTTLPPLSRLPPPPFFRDYVIRYGLNGGSPEDSSIIASPSLQATVTSRNVSTWLLHTTIMASRYYPSREYAREILIDGFRVESGPSESLINNSCKKERKGNS